MDINDDILDGFCICKKHDLHYLDDQKCFKCMSERILELEQKLKNVNYVYAELEKNLFRADKRIVEQDNMIKVLREQEQELRQALTS